MQNNGIVLNKEGITLPVLSLMIWISTGIIYKILAIIFDKLNYVNCVFFSSLSLSILCGFIFINRLLKATSDQPIRLFLVAFNIILLYASANGYQQGYSFIADQNKGKNAFLIPFLDSRSWIPDKILIKKNNELLRDTIQMNATIMTLSEKLEKLQSSRNDREKEISANYTKSNELSRANKILQAGIDSLQARITAHNNKLNAIKDQYPSVFRDYTGKKNPIQSYLKIGLLDTAIIR